MTDDTATNNHAEQLTADDAELAIRGRLTTLEEAHNRLVSAVRLMLFALLAFGGATLFAVVLARKATS